jgi:myosin heavy subunit
VDIATEFGCTDAVTAIVSALPAEVQHVWIQLLATATRAREHEHDAGVLREQVGALIRCRAELMAQIARTPAAEARAAAAAAVGSEADLVKRLAETRAALARTERETEAKVKAAVAVALAEAEARTQSEQQARVADALQALHRTEAVERQIGEERVKDEVAMEATKIAAKEIALAVAQVSKTKDEEIVALRGALAEISEASGIESPILAVVDSHGIRRSVVRKPAKSSRVSALSSPIAQGSGRDLAASMQEDAHPPAASPVAVSTPVAASAPADFQRQLDAVTRQLKQAQVEAESLRSRLTDTELARDAALRRVSQLSGTGANNIIRNSVVLTARKRIESESFDNVVGIEETPASPTATSQTVDASKASADALVSAAVQRAEAAEAKARTLEDALKSSKFDCNMLGARAEVLSNQLSQVLNDIVTERTEALAAKRQLAAMMAAAKQNQ